MNQKEILKTIADNPALTTELKALFVRFFTVDTVALAGTNEEIGEAVRARLEGKVLVDAAFKELERYKTPEARKLNANPAR